MTSPTPIPPVELDVTPQDIEQVDTTPVRMPPLPVTVEGVTRVVQVPSVSAGFQRRTLAVSAPAIQLLGSDPRRRRAVVHCIGVSAGLVGLGSTQAEAASDLGFLVGLPGTAADIAVFSMETSTTDELWAANVGASVVTVSVYSEQWAS